MSTVNFQEIRKIELERANSCYNVHDHLKDKTLDELKKISESDRLPWHTMAINITGDLNVGTIIRTSHCLGASSVVVVGRTKLDRRSLVGAENYITVEKFRTVDENFNLKPDDIYQIFESKKLVPIFCEAGGVSLNKINWKTRIEAINLRGRQPCLVMGNETNGIPNSILSLVDAIPNSCIVSIPQHGVIRSLNVAVAHGIVAGNLCTEMRWM